MDISPLTPEEIQRLTPEEIQFTPEERDRLTPEQCAAVLEVLDPTLRLSPEEQRQREAVWQLADATGWREIARSCIPSVVESYRRGDIDLRKALAEVHRAAIGCWTQHRLFLLGETAALTLRMEPLKKARGQRPPKWPFWVQNATAMLVLEWHRRNPEFRRTPPLDCYAQDDQRTEAGDTTSKPIAWALDILTKIGWFGEAGAPKPTTVDDWVRARLRETAPPAESAPQT